MERWSSWFKAPVLKTGVRVTAPRVRIPLSPPSIATFCRLKFLSLLLNEKDPFDSKRQIGST